MSQEKMWMCIYPHHVNTLFLQIYVKSFYFHIFNYQKQKLFVVKGSPIKSSGNLLIRYQNYET